ncbi:MAG: fatty acid cis/trans isomerase [Rhodospirillales bacterium]|nr:MAG: fatty acid cis/trans isomerase [Rhodospirillales bacterium]
MNRKAAYWLCVTAFISGCAALGTSQLAGRFGEAAPRERAVETLPPQAIDYWSAVKPVIDKRCVVCHACYDAPCQLKLGSIEGIERGASTAKVYNPARFRQAPMTRLFEDAHSVAEWRAKGFFPVLNEHADTPEANREAGVLYRLLELKRAHPLPAGKRLPDSFDLSLDRKESCPKPETFDAHARKHPLWGMPYALPALTISDQAVLMGWIEQGAKYLPREPMAAVFRAHIDRWERFLNGDSLKEQLASRYIFEHLALAHLYFPAVDERKFFRLVRSATPPGQPLALIAARRPFNDPGVKRVYYRIVADPETVVAKTHMPYRLDDARMRHWRSLFIDADYEVTELPSYEESVAANPFVTFRDLPVQSRYKFLLDEAQFTVMAFIKGPVCRGQVALNVINDRFWVFFVDPNQPEIGRTDAFYASQADKLTLPASTGEIYTPLSHWRKYAARQKALLQEKDRFLAETLGERKRLDLGVIWDGDGTNSNAALTVFRHFDSATVEQGLLGTPPKTAWLIGYAVLERIHYLLVAGYDVYGNLGHQLVTRLYMDFLRMEGESNFLLLLPEAARTRERNHWYRGAEDDVIEFMTLPSFEDRSVPAIDYRTDDEKLELFGLLKKRLAKVLSDRHTMAAIPNPQIREQLERLHRVTGTAATLMPQTAFIRIRAAAGDEYVTLLQDSAHLNITSMFGEKKVRIPEEDTLSVIPGFIGSYPNAFYVVDEDALETFVDTVRGLRSEDDYARLLDAFGIRRTDPRFWTNSDTFHLAYQLRYPVSWGMLDYNRLDNR